MFSEPFPTGKSELIKMTRNDILTQSTNQSFLKCVTREKELGGFHNKLSIDLKPDREGDFLFFFYFILLLTALCILPK